MAISFSNVCEINVHDLLHYGDNLVIIDCMTFAPGTFRPHCILYDLRKSDLGHFAFEKICATVNDVSMLWNVLKTLV